MAARNDVIHAIQTWLNFGEDSVGKAHQGYFSGGGWAATALREHLEELKAVRPEARAIEFDAVRKIRAGFAAMPQDATYTRDQIVAVFDAVSESLPQNDVTKEKP